MSGDGWNTPNVVDAKGGNRLGNGQAHLCHQTAQWSTPRMTDAEHGGPNMAFSTGGTPLPAQAAQWSTPSVADVTGGRGSRSGDRKGQLLLNSMAAYVSQNSWPTPTGINRPRSEETLSKCGDYRMQQAGQKTVPLYLEEVALASSHPAPETPTDGEPSSPSRRALNPRFVEWLMGWPPGWTSYECSEMALCLWKADMQSALSSMPSPPVGQPQQLGLFGDAA